MLSRAEIERALIGWRAGQQVMREIGDKQGAALADGYVGALEMVLRG